MPDNALEKFAILLNTSDDVAVARKTIPAGQRLITDEGPLTSTTDIRMGHKISMRAIRPDAPVLKYGQIIGFATQAIRPGEHVHTHNLSVKDFDRDYEFSNEAQTVNFKAPDQIPTFQGYLRTDGRVGTRNYIALLASVNCSATVTKYVTEHFNNSTYREKYPNVDGVIALTHKSGCCLQPGDPSDTLKRVIMGMATHSNVFGYALIGLGCEGMQVPSLSTQLKDYRGNGAAPTYLVIQQSGGIRKTVNAAIEAIEELLPQANAAQRTSQPASKLVLAMQCGASDAYSGITGNPAVGAAADELIRCGGAAVLAETPEIYGAEHLLVRRAIDAKVGKQLVNLIRWWEEQATLFDTTIDNNPSPGNKEGGLTTIFEKSLGAISKAGQTPLNAVYQYAEVINKPGLGFMDSPGYDPVSMTGLAAGGANIGVFTTGRGSVYGCKPMPTLKIATNSVVYNFMPEDMDLDTGTILEGSESLDQCGQRIFDALLEMASGQPTKSEAQGIGDEEFAPWIKGPTF